MAVTLTVAQFKDRANSGNPDSILNPILEAAKVLVERYAPEAPEAVQNEATVRLASWLEPPPSSEPVTEVGEVKQSADGRNYRLGFHRSGAQDLLSPWRVIGSGTVE